MAAYLGSYKELKIAGAQRAWETAVRSELEEERETGLEGTMRPFKERGLGAVARALCPGYSVHGGREGVRRGCTAHRAPVGARSYSPSSGE